MPEVSFDNVTSLEDFANKLEEDGYNIFNSFYRSQSVKNIEGTGVGLAIVSKIISLHDGTIDFESVENKTKFIITLPDREEE